LTSAAKARDTPPSLCLSPRFQYGTFLAGYRGRIRTSKELLLGSPLPFSLFDSPPENGLPVHVRRPLMILSFPSRPDLFQAFLSLVALSRSRSKEIVPLGKTGWRGNPLVAGRGCPSPVSRRKLEMEEDFLSPAIGLTPFAFLARLPIFP